MQSTDFTVFAEDALATFAEASDLAGKKLAAERSGSDPGFASGNTFTGEKAYQNLNSISQENHAGLEAIKKEPAISRLILQDEAGQQKVVYIARKSGISLPSGKQLASYDSPIGRLAELDVGDEESVELDHGQVTFSLVEKTSFKPRLEVNGWDSLGNQYRHVAKGVFSIPSLRALLQAKGVDSSDELDLLLEHAVVADGIRAGITHQIRTAMGLRDQPILDKFQGEIFRLPLDSQLIILGPPGTGKTTTLIKRLGQKIEVNNLDERERRFAIAADPMRHESNWLMFTPSELLKHYLKEAFSREQVPASDAHIKTWDAYRSDIARNTFGVLRSANSGKYTLKPGMTNLIQDVLVDPREWFEEFRKFHELRLRTQLKDGAEMAAESAPESGRTIATSLKDLTNSLDGRSWLDVYRDLDSQESEVRRVLDDSKGVADELLKRERNLLFNKDREIFLRLTQFLAGLQQDDEPDDEDEFDEDEEEAENTVVPVTADVRHAVKAYLAALRSLARSRHRKRSIPKDSRAARIVEWLGDSLPADGVLLEIGMRISFQNGMRRFVNASRRYVADVPNSYRAFRKDALGAARFYQELPASPMHLSATELDAVVLLMLRNCRALLAQSFIARDFEAQRFELLNRIASLFRTQIMVDEATDFSVLQLACMESLTSLQSHSFFACGDFNQRITATGIRSADQLAWVSPRIVKKTVKMIYRQSRLLNGFSGELLRASGGDLTTLGELPNESTHDGVKPVLLENVGGNAAEWIARRIAEVERTVRQMPTIAVLVNSEEEVRPMAEKLSACLESVNLRAVACVDGLALGEGTDVRVFDIKHIKGLEFEAVFFDGVDLMAQHQQELFDRYLYVGATRAATYLGIICHSGLPAKLESLRPLFVDQWGG